MLPWAHAAFGYILYSMYSRWRTGQPPIGVTVNAVGAGTAFPDLFDKPLTWTIPLLPYGRSLGHSLFTFVSVLFVLYVVGRASDRRGLTTAFGIGYLSHLAGDGLGSAVSGDIGGLGFLLWPVTNVPDGDKGSFLEFFLALEPTPMVLFGLALTAVGVGVWLRDGCPGTPVIFETYRYDTSR